MTVASPGVALARAAGLQAAAADLVLFIDDDVTVEPGWYLALVGAMATGAGAAGGRIVPEWPGGREPRWLHPRISTYYGARGAGAGWRSCWRCW